MNCAINRRMHRGLSAWRPRLSISLLLALSVTARSLLSEATVQTTYINKSGTLNASPGNVSVGSNVGATQNGGFTTIRPSASTASLSAAGCPSTTAAYST